MIKETDLIIPDTVDLSDVKVDAPDDDGGLTITKYIVYAYLDGSDTAEPIVGGAESPIELTDLVNGKIYTFKIKAANGKEGEFSEASDPLSFRC